MTVSFARRSAKYGITEDELKQHLTWQATAMQFTESRFPSGNRNPTSDTVQTANRLRTDAEPRRADDQQSTSRWTPG